MAYITGSDLVGQIPTNFLAQITSDGDGGQAEALAALAKDASDWIDGYLARFNPPMAIDKNATQLTLDCLRVHAVVVMKMMLDERKKAPGEFRNPSEAFRATQRFFEAIQLRNAALPGAWEPASAPSPLKTAAGGTSYPGEVVFNDRMGTF